MSCLQSWNERVLLRPEGAYVPRFKLDPRVIRVPVVPGIDPQLAYGDLVGRGVRGVVLEVKTILVHCCALQTRLFLVSPFWSLLISVCVGLHACDGAGRIA